MISRKFDVNLKVAENQIPDLFKVVQNDKDVYTLHVRIFDGEQEINYNDITSATITFAKLDNTVVQGEMDVHEDKLTYTMGTNEISYPGPVIASVQLFGAAGERLTSARFKFTVIKDLITPSAVESTSEFPLLQRLEKSVETVLPLIPVIEEAIDKVPEMLEAEEERVTAEAARVAAEAERQTQEAARQASIADIEQRFTQLTTSQQQDAEVIEARMGFASLRQKLENVDSTLAEMSNYTSGKIDTLFNVDPDEAIAIPAMAKLNIETYTEGTNEIVHPSILFFPNKWNGYRYWMGYTCFDNGDMQYENPCIAVSDDGENWTVPDGLVNPIEPKPAGSAYLADINLFMSPDNKTMYMVFKYAGTTKITYLRSSTDGVHWTPKVKLFENTYEDVSPSVIWDGTQYVMWTVKHADNPNNIYMRTAPSPEGPWSEPILCTYVLPKNAEGTGIQVEPWHLDVRKLGNQYHMLLQADPATTKHALYFGVSDDGFNWVFGKQPLFLRWVEGLNREIYKATMWPMITDKGLKYGLWYGTQNPYYICYTEITFDRSQNMNDCNTNVAQASLGLSPWLFGDTFGRADTTNGLGTANTGQTWQTVLGSNLGIINRKAYAPVAENCRSVVDIGASDFYAEIFVEERGGGTPYLLFRYIDNNNLWRAGRTTTLVSLQKIVGGTLTDMPTPIPVVAGDRIGIECKGDQISVYINGKKRYTITDNANQAGTKIGLNLSSTTTRIGYVIAKSI